MDKLVIGEWDLTRTSRDSRFIYCPCSPIDRSRYSYGISGNKSIIHIGKLKIEPLVELTQGKYFMERIFIDDM